MCKLEIEFLINLWKSSVKIWVSAAPQALKLTCVDLVRLKGEYVSGLFCEFDSFEAGARKMSPVVCEFYDRDTQRVTRQKATVWI